MESLKNSTQKKNIRSLKVERALTMTVMSKSIKRNSKNLNIIRKWEVKNKVVDLRKEMKFKNHYIISVKMKAVQKDITLLI